MSDEEGPLKRTGSHQETDKELRAESANSGQALTCEEAIKNVSPGFNSFQIRTVLILNIVWSTYTSFLNFIPFMHKSPRFYCSEQNAPDGSAPQECLESLNLCESMKFIPEIDSVGTNWITDFEFFCDRRYLLGMAGSIMFVGAMVGSYAGPLSDQYGRKYTLLAFCAFVALGDTLLMLSSNENLLFVSMFILGVGHSGSGLVSFVLASEYCQESVRHISGTIFNFGTGLGGIVTSIVAISIDTWRKMIFVCWAQIVLSMVLIYYLPESPVYSIMKGNMSEAKNTFAQMAKTNGTKMFSNAIKKASESSSGGNPKTYSMLSVLKYASIRGGLIGCAFLWFTCGLNFNGVSFLLPTMTSDPNEIYEFNIVLGIANGIACLLTGWLAGRFGRKKVLIPGMYLGAIAFYFFPYAATKSESMFLLSTAYFSACGGFCMAYILTAELFPVSVTSTVGGLCSLVGRLGGVVASSLVVWAAANDISSAQIFGLTCAICATLGFLVPETKGRSQPEEIEEETVKAKSSKDDSMDELNGIEIQEIPKDQG